MYKLHPPPSPLDETLTRGQKHRPACVTKRKAVFATPNPYCLWTIGLKSKHLPFLFGLGVAKNALPLATQTGLHLGSQFIVSSKGTGAQNAQRNA